MEDAAVFYITGYARVNVFHCSDKLRCDDLTGTIRLESVTSDVLVAMSSLTCVRGLTSSGGEA